MNKDVLFTIYEIIHRDLTKQLNTEYIERLKRCTYDHDICTSRITIQFDEKIYRKSYNYRSPFYRWRIVYTKNEQRRCTVSKNY